MKPTHIPAIFIITIIISCSALLADDNRLSEALEKSGDNSVELQKVLDHYQNDSLKYQAAVFLISNMDGHGYVTFEMVDSLENAVDFDVLNYVDFDALLEDVDRIEAERGSISYQKQDFVSDLENIKAEFLMENIDYAFRAWREKPWSRDLNFEQFCAYILPYRGSNEPLESWRPILWEKYKDIESQMTDSADPIEAAAIINDDIMSWFKFDERYYYHPTDQGLTEMMQTQLGRCEDMTNLAIYAMRANGLAVTSDYTPHWANTGNNHAWNAIITPEGEVIPFMGAEANPGKYALANKLAKAYRKMYAQQTNNLVFQETKEESVPGWLNGKSYIDVTNDYVPTADIDIGFEKSIPDSADIAYLCVFNDAEWKPIDWARIDVGKNQAVFTNMGMEVAYLPALYLEDEIVPYADPFIMLADGSRKTFLPDKDILMDIEINSTTKRAPVKSTTGIKEKPLKGEAEYELFYWDEGWQSLKKKTATGSSLIFEDVPSDALYWLVEVDGDRDERIFSIENGRLIWW